jgi:hypothetical protein
VTIEGLLAPNPSKLLSSPQNRGKLANSHNPKQIKFLAKCHLSFAQLDILNLRAEIRRPGTRLAFAI